MHKKVKQLIEVNHDIIVDIMALQDWDIEVRYVEQPCQEDRRVSMDNTIQVSYLTSTITVYPMVADMPDKEVLQTYIHELAHIITEPMYDVLIENVSPHLRQQAETLREQATERIARIAYKAYETYRNRKRTFHTKG